MVIYLRKKQVIYRSLFPGPVKPVGPSIPVWVQWKGITHRSLCKYYWAPTSQTTLVQSLNIGVLPADIRSILAAQSNTTRSYDRFLPPAQKIYSCQGDK